MILLGSVVLLFVKDIMAVIFAVYALIYMIQFAYQPVMTALCLCRIYTCGGILDHFGIRVMLITGTVVCAVGAVIGTIAMNSMKHRATGIAKELETEG